MSIVLKKTLSYFSKRNK